MNKIVKMWVITAVASDEKTGRYICWNNLFDRKKDATAFLKQAGWTRVRGYGVFCVTRVSVVYNAR